MKNPTRMLLAATMAILVGSCNTSKSQILHASFDLPDGWELIHEEPGYFGVGIREPSEDGVAPHVKIETIPNEIFRGDEEAAEDYIRNQYILLQPASGAEVPPDELGSITLPSGIVVHTHVSQNLYWGQPSWGTYMAFHSDGYIVNLYINDRAELYNEVLDQIATTASVRLVDRNRK